MPIPAATTSRFWCIICETHHLSKSIVNRHELGRAIPGGVTSAVVDGRVDAEDLAEERPRKRARQDAGHVTGQLDDAPMVPNDDTFTPGGPGTSDESVEQDRLEQAVPAAVLSGAATAWTRLGRAWIEDVPDEGDAPEGEHNTFSEDEGEEEDPDAVYDEMEDNEEELEAWIREMEDELRREMEVIGTELSEGDRAVLRAVAYKLKHRLTSAAFDDLPFLHPDKDLPHTQWKAAQTRLTRVSGLVPVIYDCCINSCCCFTGPWKTRDACPYCGEDRFRNGRARHHFSYLPIILRLQELLKNLKTAQMMEYRGKEFKHDPNVVRDVLDGKHYRSLLGRLVTPVGLSELRHKYFEDHRDIALGLSTDGYAPFKNRRKTAWPLIIYNYNLPPETRFLEENVLFLGVIPGPNKPKDFDSFLWPLIEELLVLEGPGVDAWDAVARETFRLHAHLLLVFGDIPAVSMAMRMKGHNGFSPCRYCEIKGVKNSDGPYYVPLDRSNHPSSRAPGQTLRYDPLHLPMRTHAKMMDQAREIQMAPTQSRSNSLATECGIKGIPLLSYLSSISFPSSFPFDFMHLMWENVVKNLFMLWTGKYKGMGTGTGNYSISDADLKEIGKLSEAAGAHIPYVFGPRPPDVSADKVQWTADLRSFWTTHLAPPLLKDRLPEPYFRHFVELVRLINICHEFDMDRSNIQELRDGFARWVTRYEELYYQNDPTRLAACPLTIHALLHIADAIEAMGPVWAAWAFPTERACGRIQRAVKGKRFVYSSIDKYVLHESQLSLVKIKYPSVVKELALRPASEEQGVAVGDYAESKRLLFGPHALSDSPLDSSTTSLLARTLRLRFDCTAPTARRVLGQATDFIDWAAVRVTDGGDRIRSSSRFAGGGDSRDASWVQYVYVEPNPRAGPNTPPFTVVRTYGHLRRLISFTLPAANDVANLSAPTTLAYGLVEPIAHDARDDLGLGLTYFSKHLALRMVDLTHIKCLVGRFAVDSASRHWNVVDRNRAMPLDEIEDML